MKSEKVIFEVVVSTDEFHDNLTELAPHAQ